MYSDYQQPVQNKKKIIVVSVLMGLIILALIIVLVNAILRRNRLALGKKNEANSGMVLDQDGNLVESNTSGVNSNSGSSSSSSSANATGTTSSESGSTSSSSSEVASTSGSSSSSDSSRTNPSSTSSSSSSSSNDNLPTTGPAETANILGLSLLLGSVTAYLLSNKKLHLENR